MFHSGGDALLEFQGALPFTVIADPEKKLYAEFGVGSSLRAGHVTVWGGSSSLTGRTLAGSERPMARRASAT